MGTTPLGLVYPDDTDTVDVAGDLQALATGVDALVTQPVTNARFKVYQTTGATVSMPNIVWTSIAFNAEEYDASGGHDNTTNPSRYTVPAGLGGLWLVGGKVSWDNNTAGRRQSRWRINGSTVVLGSELSKQPTSGGSFPYSMHEALTMPVPLSAGDYIELQCNHDSGSARTLQLGADLTSIMWGVRLSS